LGRRRRRPRGVAFPVSDDNPQRLQRTNFTDNMSRQTMLNIESILDFDGPPERLLVGPRATPDETLTPSGIVFAVLFDALQKIKKSVLEGTVHARQVIDFISRSGDPQLSWLALSCPKQYSTARIRAILVRNILASGLSRFAALALSNGRGLRADQKRRLAQLAQGKGSFDGERE
jgi:hypothetical protein